LGNKKNSLKSYHPREKIYGLLEIASGVAELVISTDYSQLTSAVYKAVARTLIGQENIEILTHYWSREVRKAVVHPERGFSNMEQLD
jgi:hypothetical protein